jgi:hypothetical protein
MTMGPCDDFRDLLLDHLYGLLDGAEEESLRAHLADCGACREALAQAKNQQAILARAAQVYTRVPVFAPPGEAAPSETPAPATLPLLPPVAATPASSPPRRLRRWALLAVAASVLLAAGALALYYQQGLAPYEADLAQARKQVEDVEARFSALQKNFREETAKVLAQGPAPVLHLQAGGAASYRPDAPSPIQVKVKDAKGQPTPADVTVRLVTGKDQEVFREDYKGKAEVATALPAGLAVNKGASRLVVEARTSVAAASVQEPIRIDEPTFVSHLSMNKSVYQVGDVLFFRSLTLERFSLKPPAEKIPLTFTLLNAQGQAVKQFPGLTGPGGIVAGELAVTPDLVGGDYSLQVAEATPQGRMTPCRHRFEVLAEARPRIQFDRPNYRPGDTVNAQLELMQKARGTLAPGPAKVKATVDNKGIPINVNGSPAPVPPGVPAALPTNAAGKANIQFKLPAPIEEGKAVLELQVSDGKKAQKVLRSIPVVPSHLDVQFFPEGGVLVAGVPNRVYFRVRTPLGEPIDPEGHVIVLSEKKVPFDSNRQQGAGVFTFTPEPTEKYLARVTSPRGFRETANPFKEFPIQAAGVALSVPHGVSAEGEPLAVEVRNSGEERLVVVLVTCRGRVVAQQFLAARKGLTQVNLSPVAGTRGVVRVTLCMPAADNSLSPLAERLAYRRPAQQLTIALRDALKDHRAGSRVTWDVNTTDEKGRREPIWLGCTVVDDKVQRPDAPAAGLPAHFYLLSEVCNPEDLDDADLIVEDRPEARQALDLFLGTRGCRRFVPVEPAQFALGGGRLGERGGKGGEAGPTILVFNRQNDSLANLRAQGEARLRTRLDELRQESLKSQTALQQERDQAITQARAAATALADYRARPGEYLRLGAGMLALGLLGAGCLFLLIGLVRVLRQSASTGAFAAATGTLLACLLLYAVSGSLPAPSHDAQPFLAWLPTRAWPLLPDAGQERARPDVDREPDSLGRFAFRPVRAMEAESPAVPKMSSVARAKADALLAHGDIAGSKDMDRFAASRSAELQKRFLHALSHKDGFGGYGPDKQGESNGKKGEKKGTVPSSKSPGGGGSYQLGADFARDFVYRRSLQGSDAVDTLLWQPALWLPNGTTRLSFDLPQYPATYRVFLLGNCPSGRVGAYQGKLQAK